MNDPLGMPELVEWLMDHNDWLPLDRRGRFEGMTLAEVWKDDAGKGRSITVHCVYGLIEAWQEMGFLGLVDGPGFSKLQAVLALEEFFSQSLFDDRWEHLHRMARELEHAALEDWNSQRHLDRSIVVA